MKAWLEVEEMVLVAPRRGKGVRVGGGRRSWVEKGSSWEEGRWVVRWVGSGRGMWYYFAGC